MPLRFGHPRFLAALAALAALATLATLAALAIRSAVAGSGPGHLRNTVVGYHPSQYASVCKNRRYFLRATTAGLGPLCW